MLVLHSYLLLLAAFSALYLHVTAVRDSGIDFENFRGPSVSAVYQSFAELSVGVKELRVSNLESALFLKFS